MQIIYPRKITKSLYVSDSCELHEIITRGSQAVTWSTVIHNHGILDIISYTSYKHIQLFSSDQSARESGQNGNLDFLVLSFSTNIKNLNGELYFPNLEFFTVKGFISAKPVPRQISAVQINKQFWMYHTTLKWNNSKRLYGV